jgi:hypothetical protein
MKERVWPPSPYTVSGFPPQGLIHETGDHIAVALRVRPRAVDVEIADHADSQAPACPYHRHVLVQQLAHGIDPSGSRRRAQPQIILLRRRPADAFPVDLRGRSETDRETSLGASLEDHLRPPDVHPHRSQGIRQHPRHPYHRCQMEHPLHAFESPAKGDGVRDVSDEDAKAGMIPNRLQVLQASPAQIVQDGDSITLLKETLHEMGADEARAAGHQDPHITPPGWDWSGSRGGRGDRPPSGRSRARR